MSAENNSFERITLPDNFAGTIYASTANPAEPGPFFKLADITNPHPWLNNLRSLAQMLEGEIQLPHEIRFSGNARQKRRQRRAEERGEPILRSHPLGYRYRPSRCQICLAAAKQRRAYQRQKAS